MPKVFHAITIAAVTSAGLLVLSAKSFTGLLCDRDRLLGGADSGRGGTGSGRPPTRGACTTSSPADQQRIRCGHQRRIAPRSEVLHCREQSSLSA